MKRGLFFFIIFLLGSTDMMNAGLGDCFSSLCAALRSLCYSRQEDGIAYSKPLLKNQPAATFPPRMAAGQPALVATSQFAIPLPRPRTPRAVTQVKRQAPQEDNVSVLERMYPTISPTVIFNVYTVRMLRGARASFNHRYEELNSSDHEELLKMNAEKEREVARIIQDNQSVAFTAFPHAKQDS